MKSTGSRKTERYRIIQNFKIWLHEDNYIVLKILLNFLYVLKYFIKLFNMFKEKNSNFSKGKKIIGIEYYNSISNCLYSINI